MYSMYGVFLKCTCGIFSNNPSQILGISPLELSLVPPPIIVYDLPEPIQENHKNKTMVHH